MQDIDVETFNLRALYGFQASKKFMLKSGIGYRHLYHYWQNRQGSTGAYGYDREQEYTYIPIIAELNSSKGIFKLEYDYIFKGTNNSYAGYLGGAIKTGHILTIMGTCGKFRMNHNMVILFLSPIMNF